MNQKYEVLMLAVPEVTQDEIKNIEKQVDTAVSKAKGNILAFDRWGKFKLAYPVRRNEYGVYFLARFEVPNGHNMANEIRQLFKVKLDDVVMRHVVSRVEGDSLEYQRPKSLEETPTSRDMNTFLKENKMEGLLSTVDAKEKAPVATQEVKEVETIEPAPEAAQE